MNSSSLHGCSPVPLASYLKALGILRILSEQMPEVKCHGYWRNDVFILHSDHDEASLLDFFLHRYRPSPIAAPWNGGSGFYSSDNSKAIETIIASESDRFASYRETVQAANDAISHLGLKAKPEKDQKEKLLLRCRNTFSDEALEWLDSAFILTDDGAKFPPLLGTGGNDGRLEFTNNFMQRLTEVFDFNKGTPVASAEAFLKQSLFGGLVKGLQDNPIGQFNPNASGGANATTGFDAKSAVNPWDYILALEGTLLFAAASVKRLEGRAAGQLVYPFCVHSSGSGYGSSANADEKEARCEIWMPIWNQPSTLREIKNLFSEGRAWVGKRPAKNGVDFALAIASLGVDRGIAEFQRYGFLVRNGLAYFATPLQRFTVKADRITIDLIASCDGWLQRFLQAAKNDTAPGSVTRAGRQLELAIFARASSPQHNNPATAQELLIALGHCERAIARSAKWRAEAFVQPIPPLPDYWISFADTGSTEFRLAASLASLDVIFKGTGRFPIRRHLEPVKIHASEGRAWWDDSHDNEVAWHEGLIIDVLCNIMQRRLLLAKGSSMDSWPEYAKITAWPSDIAAFIEGRIDEKHFAELLWGLCLIQFPDKSNRQIQPRQPDSTQRDVEPPALYTQLKLCFTGNLSEDKEIPIEPVIFNLAKSGDGERASRQALRRLHGSNVPVHHVCIALQGEPAQRIAAALLFPLWKQQLEKIGTVIVDPSFFKAPKPVAS